MSKSVIKMNSSMQQWISNSTKASKVTNTMSNVANKIKGSLSNAKNGFLMLGKSIKNIKIPKIKMPVPSASITSMSASDNSKKPKKIKIGEKLSGIGGKIASGFQSGFSMAAKGVGIVTNALQKIAPERMAKLSGMWNNAFGGMAASLATKLAPAFDKLEQFMMSAAFQTFMSNLEGAISCLIPVFTYIVGLAEPLFDIINQAFSFIIDNSGTIITVLLAIAGAIALITLFMTIYNGVLTLQGIISSIVAGEVAILNAVMAMNPVIFIVSAIIVLIMILIALIATVKPVREAFAKLAETYLYLVEFGINCFIKALAGLAKGIVLFAQMGINAFLNTFVNPFIDAINQILDAIEFVTGKNFDRLQNVSVDFSENAEMISENILSKQVDLSEARKAVGDGIRNFDANKITKSIKGAFGKGAEGLENLGNKNAPTPPPMSNGPQTNNDVNMQDQDMQLLREVAERESINSYTTMTPSVKIDVGNINENADSEKIIREIVEKIILEIEASAKGVVTV